MTTLLSAREVALASGRSKSQVCRDANDGKIAIAHRLAGKRGALLFTAEAAAEYAEAHQ